MDDQGDMNYDHNGAHYRLRTAVYNKLYHWDRNSEPNEHPRQLARLLGRYDDFRYPMTEREISICHSLLGEHGWTVYKMLLAQKG